MNELNIEQNRRSVKYQRKEQLQRVAWMFGNLLFRYSFRTMFSWRRFLLRMFGAKVGHNVNVYNTATIYMPWNLSIDDYSAIGEYSLIYNLGHVSIGKSTTISQRAHICAGSHDYEDPNLPLLKLPIKIGDNVWVCADAFVSPGIEIGTGAVIGARSVVTKNIEPWAVVAGNPAKFIKTRQLKKQPS